MPEKKAYNSIIILVFLIFFIISFITNILNSIINDVRETFNLSFTATGFLPFSFFVAYGIMSVPAGILAEKYPEKKILIISFIVIISSSLGFALVPSYSLFLVTLFFLGCSMAVLQVIINPLLRTAGGEKHFAFNSVMAQLIFGIASFLSPFVYQSIVTEKPIPVVEKLIAFVPDSIPWVTLYIIFSVVSFLLLPVILKTKFPDLIKAKTETSASKTGFQSLLVQKTTYLYFFGIFAYVGIEQGIGNWISTFLKNYHGADPQILGAQTVSYFWGMLTLGCLLGLLLLKFVDSRKVLIGFSVVTILALLSALFGNLSVALIAFPATGFFISVMWSVIFALGLNSVKQFHGSLSGILCTGIAGGAFIPLFIGLVSEQYSLKTGMLFMLLPLLYILSIGFWAKPIINNQTVSSKKSN